jgi:hypothetical protein
MKYNKGEDGRNIRDTFARLLTYKLVSHVVVSFIVVEYIRPSYVIDHT